jgi:hypothetical protein
MLAMALQLEVVVRLRNPELEASRYYRIVKKSNWHANLR